MKAFALILLIAGSLVLSGCESDMPPEPNRDHPIQRGLRGEGSVKPRDFSDDPYVRAQPGDTY